MCEGAKGRWREETKANTIRRLEKLELTVIEEQLKNSQPRHVRIRKNKRKRQRWS